MPYSFDPNLNVVQSLEYEPIPELNLTSCPNLPEDWLNKLATICNISPEAFTRHTNKIDKLAEGLKVIYRRLTGELNAQLGPPSKEEQAHISAKLAEGISQCTPGFHDRVNSILLSFQQPKNLKQLLFKVRMGLVEKAAVSLTDEVHAHNHCFKIANLDGLGVQAIWAEDPYRGNLTDEQIRAALEDTFSNEYRALNLPFLLADMLRGILLSYGYVGKQESGYKSETYLKIVDYLQELYQTRMESADLFLMDETETKILDIKWTHLYHLFLDTLYNQKIIKTLTSITPTTLIDCAHVSKLFYSGNRLIGFEEEIIFTLFANDSFNETAFNQFLFIQKEHPAYFNALIPLVKAQKEFQLKILFYLIDQSKHLFHENFSIYHMTRNLKNLIMGLSLYEVTDQSINIIKTMLTQVMSSGYNALMLAAQYQPTVVAPLLDFLSWHHEKLGGETLTKMLTQVTSSGHNALILAAQYQPTVVAPLLDFLSWHHKKLGGEALTKMLTQVTSSGHNALMLAAQYQPTAVAPLLDFLSRHSEKLESETLTKMLTQVTLGGWNALMEAAQYQPTVVAPLLDFLSRHHEKFGSETLTKMLTQVTSRGWNALMLAAHCQPTVVAPLLDFLSRHSEKLESETLTKMLTQVTLGGWNALMEAAHCQPTVVAPLLDFVSQHLNTLDNNTLKRIFIGWKPDFDHHVVNFFKNLCVTEANKETPNFSDKVVASAQYTIGRDKLCSIFIESANTLAQEQAKRYLSYGLSKNNPLGKFLATHRGIGFFDTKSQEAIKNAIAEKTQTIEKRLN